MTPPTSTCGAKERAHRLGRGMTQKRLSHTTAINPVLLALLLCVFPLPLRVVKNIHQHLKVRIILLSTKD